MITSNITGVKVSGILSALPTRKIDNIEYANIFGTDTVTKTIDSTGVKSTYHSIDGQTASDLAYIAANKLLTYKKVKPTDIGILIFVGAHHDYIAPATAFVLQHRLGISQKAIVFDINLGCSGFVYGLQVGASLLKSTSADKALVLLGDSSSRVVSPDDTSRLLFGDSGAAMLIEKTGNKSDCIKFGLKSDGGRFNDIYIPAGGFRHMNSSHELKEDDDGHKRSAYHSHMQGTDVFIFSVTDVPELVRSFIDCSEIDINDIDYLFMHQPNLFIIKNIIKRLKIKKEKVPLTIDKYGNTSGVSIPITMSDCLGKITDGKKRVLLLGFGIGLSWGVAYMDIDTNDIFPIVKSDEYYNDGLL